ncbi:MAG: cupin [Halothiobacillaceae bacterium]
MLRHLPDEAPDEVFETIRSAPGFNIERIVSRGQATPEGQWYDQPQHEWVLLVQGSARLRFERPARTVELGPGDWVDLPAHCRHRVEWTAPDRQTVWLAVHWEATNPQVSGVDSS